MSDYLWDRTGEADPEVERLESLLGGLAHRPRPLELPPVAGPRARRFPSARLAAAAAVLLAVLAGAPVALRFARVGGGGAVVKTAPERTPAPRESNQTPEPAPRFARDEGPAPREPQHDAAAQKQRRPRRPTPRAGTRALVAAARAPAADARSLEAKEQLVYALLLTGAKLEEVRRRVQGADETEPAPAGRGGSR